MLERFRKSETQHADPDVRVAALLELPTDHDEFIKALSDDPDESVRARLVERLTTVAELEARLDQEASGKVRDALEARLRQVLIDPELCTDDALSAYAATCKNAELLSHIALHARGPAQRRAALARHEGVAKADDAHALLQLAVASRDRDAELQHEAQSAIDQLDVLDVLVQRTRKSDKVSHRFARERQRALRDAAMAEEKITSLKQELEDRAGQAIEANSDAVHQAVARHQQWSQRWSALVANADAPDVSALVAKVEASIDAARSAVSGREALIAEVQAQDGALDESALRARWDALPDPSPRETELFEQGLIAWSTLTRKLAAAGNAWEAGRALLDAAEEEGATTTLKSLQSSWASLKLGEATDDEQRALLERYAARVAVLEDLARKKSAAQARAVEQAEGLLVKLRESLDAGQISAATSACDRLTHRLRVRENLSGPPLAKLEKGLAELAPRLAELKQARIWSTQQARQELIAEAEALALQIDDVAPKARATHIRTLRSKWRELDHGIGPAHQDIWSRFDTACKTAYEPAKAHFDQAAKERGENKSQREAVCARLEALDNDTDWDAPDYKAIEKVLNQTRRQWREAGSVNHRDMKPLRKRYDAAHDAIEKHLSPERERELRRRQLAIKSLETSIANDPLPAQIELAKRIQRDWAPSVRGRRQEEQKLWDSLRKLCDSVFEQRNVESKNRRAAEDEAVAGREAILDELAKLKTSANASADEAAQKALTASFSDIKTRWREAGHVHPKKRAALQKRFQDLSRSIESVQKDVRRKVGARKDQALLDALEAVDARWRALSGGNEADEVKLADLPGPLGRRVAAAATAAPTIDPDGSRAALCLRAELDADVASPAEFSGDRMKLKVERLNAAMAGASAPSPRECVAQLAEAWLDAPLEGDDSDAATWGRFRVALDALVHRR